MDILVVGKVMPLSEEFFKPLIEDHRCVVYSDIIPQGRKNGRVIYRSSELMQLKELFHAYRFDMVIYLSKAIDGGIVLDDEMTLFENTVYLSYRNRVKNFVFIEPNDVVREEMYLSSRKPLLEACEQIVGMNASHGLFHVQLLHVPYLYSHTSNAWSLSNWVKGAAFESKVRFDGRMEARTDFLHDGDLGELLSRIADRIPDEPLITLNLTGENVVHFSDVAKKIYGAFPETEVSYRNETLGIPIVYEDETARELYGWFARRSLNRDMELIIDDAKKELRLRQRQEERQAAIPKGYDMIRKGVEIILMFLVSEALNRLVADNMHLQFLDFRLFAILMIGNINGLMSGFISALLACLGYLLESHSSMNWNLLLFHVENWLPFAVYILIGSISGYVSDRREAEIAKQKTEYAVLEHKYDFLNHVYEDVLKSSEEYNNQIIGYRDSYGKIYNMVKRLDQSLLDQVFYEAIPVLEDLLQNQSAAIYSLESESGFARLTVSSSSIQSSVKKTLNLDDYPEIMNTLLNGEDLFVNRSCLDSYPSYAVPIKNGESITGFIMIMDASDDQMNLEFSNKLFIISNLIAASLVRAFRENRESFEPGTKIVKADVFAEMVRTRQDMMEQKLSDFCLLRLAGRTDYTNLAAYVRKYIRRSDFLGMGRDGRLYLLLIQPGPEGIGIVKRRFQNEEIFYEEVTALP